ncbi:MAG: hypothetical protein ACRYF0_07665 [Janthinobacterium lividum]
MSKKLHVNCFLVFDKDAEAFRHLVDEYNNPASYEEHQAEGYEHREPVVEILYEESSKGRTGFDLWFRTPAIAFYFGVAWVQRLTELAQLPAEVPAAYPKFLYEPRMRTWLRYNSPEYFCLVSASQLQVRRARPQELYKPEQVQVITEAEFLKAYQVVASALRDFTKLYEAEYQRRGGEGNEWFYRNPKGVAANVLPQHLRLHSSTNEYGRSWQFMYAHDMHRNDARRVASTEQDFTQQLEAMLADVEAAATGQQEGGLADG